MKRKALSFILSLAMLTGMAMFSRISAMAASPDTWDGTTIDTSWHVSDPTATNFAIGTGAQLAGLAKLANEGTRFSGDTVTLAADIDLGSHQWTPIGNDSNGFDGTFDGANHTISGLAIGTSGGSNSNIYCVELFGYTRQSATIKDVNIDAAGRSF